MMAKPTIRPMVLDPGEVDALASLAVSINSRELARTGGVQARGQSDYGRIASIMSTVYATYFGVSPAERYSDFTVQVVTMMDMMVSGHPFVDGNKRTALIMTITIIRVIGFDVNAEDTPEADSNVLYQLVTGMASSRIDREQAAGMMSNIIVRKNGVRS